MLMMKTRARALLYSFVGLQTHELMFMHGSVDVVLGKENFWVLAIKPLSYGRLNRVCWHPVVMVVVVMVVVLMSNVVDAVLC